MGQMLLGVGARNFKFFLLRFSASMFQLHRHLLRRRCLSSISTSEIQQNDGRCLAQTIADLINNHHAAPWPHDFASLTLTPLLSQLSPSSLLLALSLLKSSAAVSSLFDLAVSLRLPLDHRHSSLTLHHLLRRLDPTPALDFLLSLKNSPSLLHDKLFNPLLRSLGRRGRLRHALRLFRLMPQFNIPPSVYTYNSLLSALLARGRTQNARNLFDEMLSSNVAPDACTFNTLIRGFCLSGLLDDAFGLFHEMRRRHGCCPDVLTYNTLLDGLCRAGKVETARNFLDGMKRRGEEGVSPNVVSYTTLIRGYCGCGDVAKAVEVLDEMGEVGLKPNKVTYNTIVKGLCEARRMDLVKEVLERDTEFKPDTCTFNTLMEAHCGFGKVDDAVKVFERMLELHVKTDSASYSTLIRGLCKNGDFERAEELVDEILEKGVLARRGVCIPLLAAYNPIFQHLCKNGKAEKAGTLLKQLVERRATVDIAAFKTVILGYCREGQLREGYKLLVSMVRMNFKPDLEIFVGLIEGFLSKEDMGFAWKALERMLSCGHRPSTSMFHSVLAGLLKKDGSSEEACNLITVMLERKVRHNIDLSTDVVAGLIGMGLNDKAFEIVRLLYDNGYCVKMEKLVGCLCKEKKYLEAHELLLFSLKKNENLDDRVYAGAISGLCATGKASVAFELFYGMTDKGIECSTSSCLNDLRKALETTGKLREAEFVSKQMNRLKNEQHMLKSTNSDMLAWAPHDVTHRLKTYSKKVLRERQAPDTHVRHDTPTWTRPSMTNRHTSSRKVLKKQQWHNKDFVSDMCG